MALAVVTRIRSLPEAQIAAGALRSAGIDAEVFDSIFGGMEAPVIEGLGGYRLMAPETQAVEARKILRMLQASPGLGEPDEVAPWSASLAESARTRKRGMRALALILLGIPAVFWLIRWLTG
jgi:Putative prokaryotic signal transducing protein